MDYEKQIEQHYETCPRCNVEVNCAEDELFCPELDILLDKATP